jgi:hypothetical protein
MLINMAMSADIAFCRVMSRAAEALNGDSRIKRSWRRIVGKSSRNDKLREKGGIELQP